MFQVVDRCNPVLIIRYELSYPVHILYVPAGGVIVVEKYVDEFLPLLIVQ